MLFHRHSARSVSLLSLTPPYVSISLANPLSFRMQLRSSRQQWMELTSNSALVALEAAEAIFSNSTIPDRPLPLFSLHSLSTLSIFSFLSHMAGYLRCFFTLRAYPPWQNGRAKGANITPSSDFTLCVNSPLVLYSPFSLSLSFHPHFPRLSIIARMCSSCAHPCVPLTPREVFSEGQVPSRHFRGFFNPHGHWRPTAPHLQTTPVPPTAFSCLLALSLCTAASAFYSFNPGKWSCRELSHLSSRLVFFRAIFPSIYLFLSLTCACRPLLLLSPFFHASRYI